MKTYFPVINLLRALAVIMICLYHFTHFQSPTGLILPIDHWLVRITENGETWVYTFFVISGFVLPLSMEKGKYLIKRFFHFMGRRLVRIEIPYISSVLLILFVSGFFAIKNNEPFDVDAQLIIYHILFFIPFTEYEWLNPIYWTLGIEMQFYILIGLIYPLLFKKTWVVVTTLMILAISSVFINDIRYVFYYGPIFASGIALYLTQFLKIRKELGMGMVVLFIALTWYNTNTDIAVVQVLSLLAIAAIEVDRKWVNYLGSISYSLYLTHGIAGLNLILILISADMGNTARIGLCLAALVFAIIFAHFHWRFVERPATKLSRKIEI